MGEHLCSVGLDVGTTTTQLIVSELTVENQAGAFAVPQMAITDRKILYKSPVLFTPLLGETLVDGPAIRELILREYEKAGISREQVDTGAVIITGESSRKENARSVLKSLSGFAGDFVVATAGPDLESVLAARGSGAAEESLHTGKTILHMDIGGGTSNLALIEDGQIIKTGCLNVGGRLLKLDNQGAITYRSPVLEGLTTLAVRDIPTREQIFSLAELLVQALEMAAGLRPPTELLTRLTTQDTVVFLCSKPAVLSFSGGVADCICESHPYLAFGDFGPELGQAIARSRLCAGEYRLGQHTIRATVIGAGCYSTQLSGSTVFYQNVTLPLKNLPVAVFPQQQESLSDAINQALSLFDGETPVLALPGLASPDYRQVKQLALEIVRGLQERPVYICMEQDMAKALGQAICLLQPEKPCICLDGIRPERESYLDIGLPVGPALPVVVKTLALSSPTEIKEPI